MKSILIAGAVVALAVSHGAAGASPKYTAPINVAKTATIRVKVEGAAPSPITETVYVVAGDVDGDGVAGNGTLRVASRDGAVAFVSFRHAGGGIGSGKSSETQMMLKAAASDVSTALVGRDVEVVVQRPASGGKTMSEDSWHNATIKAAPQLVCS